MSPWGLDNRYQWVGVFMVRGSDVFVQFFSAHVGNLNGVVRPSNFS